MDVFWILFITFVVMTPSELAEPRCEDLTVEMLNLHEGEAFYFVPYDLEDLSDNEVIWYKNNDLRELISTDENQRVHYHGNALLFLNLSTEDSGTYTAMQKNYSGRCYNYPADITVFRDGNDSALLYGAIESSIEIKKVPCPQPVKKICERLNGTLTWKKNNKLMKHVSDPLWIKKSSKNDKNVYTCICTWTHNHKEYKTSGSRKIINKEQGLHRRPSILSPKVKELLVDEGSEIKLECSVLCGTNVQDHCNASWTVDGVVVNKEGSTQISQITANNPNTISTAVLTIRKVSASDFNTPFECNGEGFYQEVSETLTLKRKATMRPLIIRSVCVLCLFVLATVLIKCFTIELALLFRPCVSQINHSKDKRIYDAYVVYQMQRIDKTTEDTLNHFITKTLPSVLEDKCGYRLFIHGRDDIPGEDHLQQVVERVQQSKRLMVILTPGSGSEVTDQCPASPFNSAVGWFDWQIGIHHALIQSEISVILIQIGDSGPEGYTKLPAGLQHLILKSAPLQWKKDAWRATSCNSHFWKRVRYLMPAQPATKCPQSALT